MGLMASASIEARSDSTGGLDGRRSIHGSGWEGPFVLDTFSGLNAKMRSSGKLIEEAMHRGEGWAEGSEVIRSQGILPGDLCVNICAVGDLVKDVMEAYLPLAGRFDIYPFELGEITQFNTGGVLWPGFDQPQINRIRTIRQIGQNKSLIGAVHCNILRFGVDDLHVPTQEDMKWQVFALIGADWDGIVFRKRQVSLERKRDRFHRLEAALKVYADPLGSASPVNWVSTSDAVPFSALSSDTKLFIVLLSPDYYVPVGDNGSVRVAAEMPRHMGKLVIETPPNIRIKSAKTLFGLPVRFSQRGKQTEVEYSFEGAGEMLVFEIKKIGSVAVSSANIPPESTQVVSGME